VAFLLSLFAWEIELTLSWSAVAAPSSLPSLLSAVALVASAGDLVVADVAEADDGLEPAAMSAIKRTQAAKGRARAAVEWRTAAAAAVEGDEKPRVAVPFSPSPPPK
jgi:hypothetical protein